MASPEWLEIFRNWDGPKIRLHIERLERQISVFTEQAVGQKSYVKDLAELRGQLSAAYRILKEQSGRGNPSTFVTDFSRRGQGGAGDDPRIP